MNAEQSPLCKANAARCWRCSSAVLVYNVFMILDAVLCPDGVWRIPPLWVDETNKEAWFDEFRFRVRLENCGIGFLKYVKPITITITTT